MDAGQARAEARRAGTAVCSGTTSDPVKPDYGRCLKKSRYYGYKVRLALRIKDLSARRRRSVWFSRGKHKEGSAEV